MTKKPDYINVPVELCEYALRNRKTNQIKLYLFLKGSCDGYIRRPGSLICEAAGFLAICPKTAKNHFKWLIKEGLLVIEKNGGVTIKSFESIYRKFSFISPVGALLYKDQIRNFSVFSGAAVYMYNVKRSFKRNGGIRRGGLKMWSPLPDDFPPYPSIILDEISSYPHFTLTSYAKKTNKSKSTAARHKKEAIKLGMIRSKKRVIDLKIASAHKENFKQHGPLNPNCIRQRGSTLIYQLPDEIYGYILLRKKHNLRRVCHENRERKKAEPNIVDTMEL